MGVSVFTVNCLRRASKQVHCGGRVGGSVAQGLCFAVLSLLFVSAVCTRCIPSVLNSGCLHQAVRVPSSCRKGIIYALIGGPRLPRAGRTVLCVRNCGSCFFRGRLNSDIGTRNCGFCTVSLHGCKHSVLPGRGPFFYGDLGRCFTSLSATLTVVERRKGSGVLLVTRSANKLVAPCCLSDGGNGLPISKLVLGDPFLS